MSITLILENPGQFTCISQQKVDCSSKVLDPIRRDKETADMEIDEFVRNYEKERPMCPKASPMVVPGT